MQRGDGSARAAHGRGVPQDEPLDPGRPGHLPRANRSQQRPAARARQQRRFKEGDTLVTGPGADIWGYLSELERTMCIGEPSAEQRRYFGHMMNLQEIAFEAMKPGVACSVVDKKVRAYYERENLWDGWRHHVGHSLGQRIHESPFLDIGDDRPLEPTMVFSIEPGIYVPGLGGFRHSDTVVVTDDGIEILTQYPREIEDLIIPVS